MKTLMKLMLLALTLLTAKSVFAAAADRFKGGNYAGYALSSVLDNAIPVSGPRIKINGVPYEQIRSINGVGPTSIINGVRY